MLSQALSDGLIGRNPAATVKVPKTQERQPRFLSAEQVTDLAGACERRMAGSGVLVKLLSYAGLRWGEAVALRAENVDPLRRLVHVRESATLVNGELVWGAPKSHRARTVVIPRSLAEELAPLLDRGGSSSPLQSGQPSARRTSFVEPGSLRSPSVTSVTWCHMTSGIQRPVWQSRPARRSRQCSGCSDTTRLRSPSTGTRICSMTTSRRWLTAWMLVTVRPRCGPNPNLATS